jgi:hypothetical protein
MASVKILMSYEVQGSQIATVITWWESDQVLTLKLCFVIFIFNKQIAHNDTCPDVQIPKKQTTGVFKNRI